ncbi:PLC-like phosphodiesterase [Lophiostoma macrostomum CBS 122681]|uniref:PLC-like phosphodiesterase n=1 Tax=Lophiostoma macrostomum CBS 122681 TaxID=1314788 RepID=A0A6A6TF11_9PLEO|nr:PLC-like phosphodiesterase [Lophiostoma macrostomum CBS 122681]
MPSKGIKCYSYINAPDITIEFSVPKSSITKRTLGDFSVDHLEVESQNLGAFKFTGRFSFTVRRGERELTTQWTDINSMTGALTSGTLLTLDATPALFLDTEDLVIVYGFYDAGPGHADLPKQHQCYVTVTRNRASWMRSLIPPGSPAASQPFSKLVLPSSHDIGMNSMGSSLALLANAGTGAIREILGRSLPGALSVLNRVADGAVKRIAPDIIRALAVTQKDSVAGVLGIGARYFEFRPARCHREVQRVSGLEDTLYFQHGAIPGMRYSDLLRDLVGFLRGHADEIVVVQLRWDGVPGECPRASEDELRLCLDDALRGSDIQVGNLEDMRRKSIKDLRNERKRLIVLRDVDQVSNYDDAASATLTGDPIVAKLQDMGRNPPKGHPITLLQCQATATNIRNVIVASVLDSDVSTSPLLATKAICDAKILPLLRGETGKKLVKEDGVVVLMNDFFDGGTADVAIELCRERLGC